MFDETTYGTEEERYFYVVDVIPSLDGKRPNQKANKEACIQDVGVADLIPFDDVAVKCVLWPRDIACPTWFDDAAKDRIIELYRSRYSESQKEDHVEEERKTEAEP